MEVMTLMMVSLLSVPVRLISRDLGLEHLNGLHPSVVLFVIHVGFFLLWAEKVPVKMFLLKLRWFKFAAYSQKS